MDQSLGARQGTLRDLNVTPVELRQRIFRTFVKARFDHEQRHLDSPLPFSLDEMHRVLGWAAVENADFPNPISTTEGQPISKSFQELLGTSAESFIEEGLRLHLLIRDRYGGVSFMHLLLRDYFGFPYALKYIQNPSKKEDWFHLNRALALVAESGNDGALEHLLGHCHNFINFPLVHLLHSFVDPRVLLAYARSLLSLEGLTQYDVVADIAGQKIHALAEKLGRSSSAQTLVAAVTASPRDESVCYLYALGYLGLSEGLDVLIETTQDKDSRLRGYAAYALGKIGSQKAVDSLRRLHTDNTKIVFNDPWPKNTTVGQIAEDSLKKIQSVPKEK